MQFGNKVDELKAMLDGKENETHEAAAAHDAEIASLREQITLLETQLAAAEIATKTAKDDQVRIYADFENSKKRLIKEKDDFFKFANEGLIKELLVVIDGFDQTLNHAGDQGELASFISGVDILRKQFVQILQKFGVKEIESVGKIFDPQVHEAVSQEASSSHPSGTVIKEWRKGYMLNDRLLRAAMVVTAQ